MKPWFLYPSKAYKLANRRINSTTSSMLLLSPIPFHPPTVNVLSRWERLRLFQQIKDWGLRDAELKSMNIYWVSDMYQELANPMSYVILTTILYGGHHKPICRWKSMRSSDFHKITQLIATRTGYRSGFIWLWSLCSFPVLSMFPILLVESMSSSQTSTCIGNTLKFC